MRNACSNGVLVVLTAALLVGALVLPGCDSNDPGGDDDDANVVSEDVGPDGGTVTSRDGNLTLTIPDGALGNTETITIEEVAADDLGPEFDEIADVLGVEHAYNLGPGGLDFQQPITASLTSDQTPVQSSDSLGVFAEFLFTSDDGAVEALDSLRTEVDAEEGTVSVQGQINHFSLVVNGSGVQTNNGVQFFVNDIPEMIEVNDTFMANAVIESSMAGPSGDIVTVEAPARYTDESGAPITADFTPLSQELETDNDGNFEGTFPYTCTSTGLGVFASDLSVQVTFDLDSGPVSAESFANFVTTVDCVETMPETVALTLQKDGDGAGTVVSEPAGINCGADCQQDEAEFEKESSVILGAEPADGSDFAGWSGDTGDANTQDSTLTVTMDSARTITATFNQAEEAAVAINSFDVVESTGLQATFDWNIQVNSDGDPSNIDVELDFGDGTTSEPSSLGDQVNDNPRTFWRQLDHTYDIPGHYEPAITLIYDGETVDQAGISIVTEAPPEITDVDGEFTGLRTIDLNYQIQWFGSTTALNASFDGNSDGENLMDVSFEPGSDKSTINGNFEYEFATDLSFPATSTFEVTNTESGQSNSDASFEVEEVTLTVDKEGQGTVTGISGLFGPNEIINCGADCQEELVKFSDSEGTIGLPTELTATPADGYVFVGWIGDLASVNDCAVNEDNCIRLDVTENLTFTALFDSEETTGDELAVGLFPPPVPLTILEGMFRLKLWGSSKGKSVSTHRSQAAAAGSFRQTAADEVSFGPISGTFPVAIAGAEGYAVIDLLTGDVLRDETGLSGGPFLGVAGASQDPPGPDSPAILGAFGQNGFAVERFGQIGLQEKVTTTFDAFPAGGDVLSDVLVVVQPGEEVAFYAFDSFDDGSGDGTYNSNSSFDFDAFQFSGELVSAYMHGDEIDESVNPPVPRSPLLILTRATESKLYLGTTSGLPSSTEVISNLGADARKVRCVDDGSGTGNLVCAVSVFGDDRLALLTWDGGETEPTLAGFADVGDGPVGIDLRPLSNGNVAVVSTGFNDNTVTVTEVAPDGSVISSNTQPALNGCQSPAHVIFVRDDVSLKVAGTCTDSDNYFIMESDL